MTTHAISGLIDALSYQAEILRLEKAGEHALNMLLFADSPIRCHYGDIPVPLCVWDGTVSPSFFWGSEKVNCAVVGPGQLANLMGCATAPPPNAGKVFVYDFKLCWAPTKDREGIRNCNVQNYTLYVWR